MDKVYLKNALIELNINHIITDKELLMFNERLKRQFKAYQEAKKLEKKIKWE